MQHIIALILVNIVPPPSTMAVGLQYNFVTLLQEISN